MAGVFFRLRKYQNGLGMSYSIYDGAMPSGVEQFAVGDTIYVMFDVEENQVAAVESLSREDFRVLRGGGRKSIAQIPCKIVARDHAISWTETGRFQHVSTSLTLEPVSGYWEDLLVWVTRGDAPKWALDEGGSA